MIEVSADVSPSGPGCQAVYKPAERSADKKAAGDDMLHIGNTSHKRNVPVTVCGMSVCFADALVLCCHFRNWIPISDEWSNV